MTFGCRFNECIFFFNSIVDIILFIGCEYPITCKKLSLKDIIFLFDFKLFIHASLIDHTLGIFQSKTFFPLLKYNIFSLGLIFLNIFKVFIFPEPVIDL